MHGQLDLVVYGNGILYNWESVTPCGRRSIDRFDFKVNERNYSELLIPWDVLILPLTLYLDHGQLADLLWSLELNKSSLKMQFSISHARFAYS